MSIEQIVVEEFNHEVDANGHVLLQPNKNELRMYVVTSEEAFKLYTAPILEARKLAAEDVGRGNFQQAYEKYRKASYDLNTLICSSSQSREYRKNEWMFYLKTSAVHCCLRLNEFQKAVDLCEQALEIELYQPTAEEGKLARSRGLAKLYFRYAQAEYELKHYGKSYEMLKKGLSFKIPAFQKFADDLRAKIKAAQRQEEKEMCKRMFAGIGANENEPTEVENEDDEQDDE